MKIGIVRFPGSNCDEDCHRAVSEVLARVGEDCRILGWWFKLVDWLRRRRFH